jgi:hypothetical protein
MVFFTLRARYFDVFLSMAYTNGIQRCILASIFSPHFRFDMAWREWSPGIASQRVTVARIHRDNLQLPCCEIFQHDGWLESFQRLSTTYAEAIDFHPNSPATKRLGHATSGRLINCDFRDMC